LATIEELSLDEDALELGKNLRVNITLREFLDLSQPTLNIASDGLTATMQNAPTRLTSVVKRPQNYIVKEGDTLKSISQKFFGNVELAQELYETNREQIDAAAAKYGDVRGSLRSGVILKLPSYARPVEGVSHANMAELTLKTVSEIARGAIYFSGISGAFKGRYYGNNVW